MIRILRTLLTSLAALATAGAIVWTPAYAAGGSNKKTVISASYVEFGGMAATIARDYRPVGILQIEVGVEAVDHHLHDRVVRLEPRLRAACAESLRIYASEVYMTGTPPDADELAAMMQGAIDQALGQEGAQLLLGTLVLHSTR